MSPNVITRRGARALLIALLLAVAAVSSAFAERHKLQVNDPSVAKEILAQGGHLVADYGGYQLYEVDHATPELEGRRGVENRDRYNQIEFNTGVIDTSSAQSQALRKSVSSFSGRRMHLVQFVGSVKPDWYQALVNTGVRVITYIPNNAYLVHGDARALGQLQAWAGAVEYVQWEDVYQDEYKTHPRARPQPASSKASAEIDQTDVMAIQLVADDDDNPGTLRLIDQLKLAPVLRQDRFLHYVNVIVRIPRERLTEVASRPDVISIQPYMMPQLFCERQDQIVAGNLNGNVPAGPGYLAWLASKGFTQAQFDASGFVVDVSDSGIDNATTSPYHFGLYTSGILPGTSRVVYNRLEGTPNSGSTLQGCDGHGNLNSHIIGGYDDSSGFPFADTNGFHYGLGVCPFVRLGSSVVFDPSTFTSPSYSNLMARAYRDGARVSNNSWGANTAGAYDSDSQQYDALVRDAQPSGSAVPNAGNQEMVIVFAAGNAGSGTMTVGAPGTAKNVIVVGAGENVQAFGGSDGSGIGDSGADSANDIISFSSRGPCADGRKKPDICAPGTHVSGGVAQTASPGSTGTANACFDGSGVSGGTGGSHFYPAGQQFYTASSGTSHSTPCVSGGCALLRQYFINNFSNSPSPAMTKAFLMNSARYMTGTSANDTLPSNNQGMGCMNLGMAFDGVARVLRNQLSVDRFTASGQTRTFTGTVADPSKPFRVTLAWTDAPGSTTGNAYNNDLDLTVTAGGNTYKGNVFSGAFSVTGGSSDTKDNVENVFLAAGISGMFTVTVTAANINSDGVPNNADPLDQDFALVVYNGSQVSAPLITAGSTTLLSEGCSPTNGFIDPGETVTVNFGLQNVGSADAVNLVATLLVTNGVTSPSGPQTYGALIAGGPAVVQPFTFIANGICSGIITNTFQLQDGVTNLGTVTFSFPLGAMAVTFTENFDGVTAPTLPAGWTTSTGGAESLWVASTAQHDTGSNSAFSPDPGSVGSNALVSPTIPILTSSAKLTFRNNYSLETSSGSTGYDGGVLEVRISSGSFQDILAAGGSFVSGGYNKTLSTSFQNPLRGRQAWSGNSGGFITTVVNLPPSAAGQNIQLRWRCGTDNSVSSTGWYIDTISISELACCTGAVTHSPVANFTASPTNGTALLLVSFTDTSTGTPPLSLSWDLGDSFTTNTAGGTSFVHSYAAGAYTVTLTASNSAGTSTLVSNNLIAVVTQFQAWQLQYFGCTNCPQAAPDADPLGKGMSNTNQFLAGLNPTNPASIFQITSVAADSSNNVIITWSTAGVRTNAVQASSGDADGNYTSNFTDTSGLIIIPTIGDATTNYLDAGGATNVPARFYRVRLVP